MKVYVLIKEYSPELALEYGGYEIIAVYDDWNKARGAALEEAESCCAVGRYKITSRFDERPEGQKVGYSLSLDGKEDQSCWFNIVVEPMEVIE